MPCLQTTQSDDNWNCQTDINLKYRSKEHEHFLRRLAEIISEHSDKESVMLSMLGNAYIHVIL